MNRTGYITIDRMEAITERILSENGFDPHGKLVGPVPIEEIVEFHYDLQICWEAIDELDSEGMVLAAIIPDRRQIILNETHRELFDQKIGTYHFTLAHELGHWVLHASERPYLRSGAAPWRNGREALPGQYLRDDADGCGYASDAAFLAASGEARAYYCRSMSRKPAEEIQADLFAGCLLMPRPMLARAVKQLNMRGVIQLHHIYGLAECLKVSISALSVRLKQLRLLRIGPDGSVSRENGRPASACEQLTLDL